MQFRTHKNKFELSLTNAACYARQLNKCIYSLLFSCEPAFHSYFDIIPYSTVFVTNLFDRYFSTVKAAGNMPMCLCIHTVPSTNNTPQFGYTHLNNAPYPSHSSFTPPQQIVPHSNGYHYSSNVGFDSAYSNTIVDSRPTDHQYRRDETYSNTIAPSYLHGIDSRPTDHQVAGATNSSGNHLIGTQTQVDCAPMNRNASGFQTTYNNGPNEITQNVYTNL